MENSSVFGRSLLKGIITGITNILNDIYRKNDMEEDFGQGIYFKRL